jgi:DNA-binding transcriptional MocR family regulator
MRITGHHKRTGVPFVRASCMILGDRQIDTFEAMLALTGRRPNQLVADLILAAIQKGQADPKVQQVEAWLRESRRGRDAVGLYIVRDREGA